MTEVDTLKGGDPVPGVLMDGEGLIDPSLEPLLLGLPLSAELPDAL